jgi:dTDP-4-amino-4,6-dideoxygalactose transaminase
MTKWPKAKRIFLSPPHMSGYEMSYIQEAFASNYIAPTGPQVDAFEREFAQKLGVPHAVAVSSGTAAMHLALRILKVSYGDKVIASTLTFIGGVSPIVFQGATPIFVDSDRTSWNMDPELLAEELEISSTKGDLPKAVVPTDLYGQCADLRRIREICKPYDIPVVVDAAESLGATYNGCPAGVGADAAIYSFNGNKIITTSNGGMIASEDGRFIEQARFLSQQARDPAPHYQHSQIGYNYRMSNILAAIGRGQLRVLDDRVERRRKIFAYYQEALAELPGIEWMPEAPYGRSNRWLTVILITPESFGSDRESVRLALEAENIEARPVWKPMHLQPVFSGYDVRGGAVSEDLFQRGLCLPSGTQMMEEDQARVVSVIKRCFLKSRQRRVVNGRKRKKSIRPSA